MLFKSKNIKNIILATSLSITSILSQSAFADEIDDFIHATMAKGKIPGLQLAVVKNNKIIKLQGYGESNVQDSVKVTNKTVFAINSITKLFTGVAIMQLAEEGKLAPDDTIGAYLPELPKEWHHITIAQLLAHTSGLPNILSGRNIDLIAGNDAKKAWPLVQTLPLQFETNSQFKYNQTGYVILGKIIDKLADQPFTEYILQGQLAKVGMPLTQSAGFAHFDYVVANRAQQYVYDNKGRLRAAQGSFTSYMRTAAGMSTTAEELANYTVALQNEKVLNNTSLKTLWTANRLNNGRTAAFNSRENGYTLGWQTVSRNSHPAISALGGDANSIYIYPDDNLTIIVLTNLIGSLPNAFTDEIASFYIDGLSKEDAWQLSRPMETLKQKALENNYVDVIATTLAVEKALGLNFNVDSINYWGYQLINEKNLTAAIEVFKLNTHLHPEVANTFDSLGEAYALNKQYAESLMHYQKVVALQPNNEYAKNQVKQLNEKLKQKLN